MFVNQRYYWFVWNDKDFKLEDDSDKVDDTSTINKSEEDKSFKSNIKI